MGDGYGACLGARECIVRLSLRGMDTATLIQTDTLVCMYLYKCLLNLGIPMCVALDLLVERIAVEESSSA